MAHELQRHETDMETHYNKVILTRALLGSIKHLFLRGCCLLTNIHSLFDPQGGEEFCYKRSRGSFRRVSSANFPHSVCALWKETSFKRLWPSFSYSSSSQVSPCALSELFPLTKTESNMSLWTSDTQNHTHIRSDLAQCYIAQPPPLPWTLP